MSIIKIITFSFISIIASISSFAVNIDKMYVQKQNENGWMFHIFSQKMPSVVTQDCSKKIKYDYTYLEETDSVSMLSTILLPQPSTPSEVAIEYSCGKYVAHPEIIYVHSKKNEFEYRLDIKIPFSIWEMIYNANSAFTVVFAFNKDNTRCIYRFSDTKKWDKLRLKMQSIIGIIKVNINR